MVKLGDAPMVINLGLSSGGGEGFNGGRVGRERGEGGDEKGFHRVYF